MGVGAVGQADGGQGGVDLRGAGGPAHALLLQRELDVLADGEPRKQAAPVLLEHHRHPGRGTGDRCAVEADLAAGRAEQAGDAAQQGGLAGAGRADDADQFAPPDPEGEIAYGLDVAAVPR
ncbi:hypothetical protein Prum_075380 [Phytohabitans rumicis]|uniref:Uncharacterized protein n=1 Tax=Phytohabitans rumicis TaxID=1076125 RepID=A0A6V8LIC4_9ACTN|nr:hypothetical protein Prum_075380 [Phytohabitans rumicis]